MNGRIVPPERPIPMAYLCDDQKLRLNPGYDCRKPLIGDYVVRQGKNGIGDNDARLCFECAGVVYVKDIPPDRGVPRRKVFWLCLISAVLGPYVLSGLWILIKQLWRAI